LPLKETALAATTRRANPRRAKRREIDNNEKR